MLDSAVCYDNPFDSAFTDEINRALWKYKIGTSKPWPSIQFQNPTTTPNTQKYLHKFGTNRSKYMSLYKKIPTF